MSMICHFLARPDKELDSYINFVENKNTLANINQVAQFVSEETQDETENIINNITAQT